MKIPKKLSLSNLPTPVQKINFKDTSFFIKRDDLTGSELSGNKIRKLDYLLYHAKRIKADYIFTCGGDQSNHCRASALAAASLGIKSKLFLWGSDKKNADGNLFLNKICNSEIEFFNYRDYQNVNEIMEMQKIEYEKRGHRVLTFPTGGSNVLGIWGYVNFVNELKEQIDLNKFKGIILAVGSGGSAAGILIGLAINKLNLKVYGVNVFPDADMYKKVIFDLAEGCIEEYGINVSIKKENLIMLNGYSEEGYKKIAPVKLRLIKNFAEQTGILLDPAYTGKAFYAYHENFLKDKKRSNILFLHTGGLFGIFSKRKEYLL